jgi:hypothetical protein
MSRFAELKVLATLMAAIASVPVAAAQDLTPSASSASEPSAGSTSSASPAPRPRVGQPASNPIIAAPGEPRPASPAPATVRPHSRLISSDVAAQLAAAVPKYTPPPPKPPPEEDDDVDMRDIDKPKNGIIRLPKYVVREPPPPVLNERAINTKKGLEDLAMRRYLTDMDRALNRFTIPLFGTSSAQRAMAMYEEDERLKNMSDLNEDARMVSASDKASGMYVKKQVRDTFVRPGDFDWRPIGR